MQIRIERFIGVLTLTAIALIGLVPVVPGQSYGQQQQPAPPATVSDDQMKAFVLAWAEIDKVRAEYDAAVREVRDPEKVTELQEKAQVKIHEAVEEQGLTVDEYNGIAAVVNKDPELTQKAFELRREVEQPRGEGVLGSQANEREFEILSQALKAD